MEYQKPPVRIKRKTLLIFEDYSKSRDNRKFFRWTTRILINFLDLQIGNFQKGEGFKNAIDFNGTRREWGEKRSLSFVWMVYFWRHNATAASVNLAPPQLLIASAQHCSTLFPPSNPNAQNSFYARYYARLLLLWLLFARQKLVGYLTIDQWRKMWPTNSVFYSSTEFCSMSDKSSMYWISCAVLTRNGRFPISSQFHKRIRYFDGQINKTSSKIWHLIGFIYSAEFQQFPW